MTMIVVEDKKRKKNLLDEKDFMRERGSRVL